MQPSLPGLSGSVSGSVCHLGVADPWLVLAVAGSSLVILNCEAGPITVAYRGGKTSIHQSLGEGALPLGFFVLFDFFSWLRIFVLPVCFKGFRVISTVLSQRNGRQMEGMRSNTKVWETDRNETDLPVETFKQVPLCLFFQLFRTNLDDRGLVSQVEVHNKKCSKTRRWIVD